MNRLLRWGALATLLALGGVLGLMHASRTGPVSAGTAPHRRATTLTETAYLYMPALNSPAPPPSGPALTFAVTPDGPLNASTFTPGSFVVRLLPEDPRQLTRLRIDLTTALLPDMVFDPFGQAGDFVAKDFTVDFNGGIAQITHNYAGARDGGFDILNINFSGFDPGEELRFSVDVDPTSIRGVPAPGPNESGSVSGLELVGATVEATLAGGQVMVGRLDRQPGSSGGGVLQLRPGMIAAPTLTLPDAPAPPTAVAQPTQRVVISCPSCSHRALVSVVVVEGGLFTAGLPGGGYDIDPFEANSAVNVQEYLATLAANGTTELTIQLSRSAAEAGINHVTAVLYDPFGRRGILANGQVFAWQP